MAITTSKRNIIYAPRIEKGKGSGHLMRALRLARGSKNKVRIYIPNDSAKAQASKYCESGDEKYFIGDLTELSLDSVIVCDLFKTSKEELSSFPANIPLLGIDEGGLFRNEIPFLIDTLPNLNKEKANIDNPGFNNPGRIAKTKLNNRNGVLVTFGGEDPAELTLKTLTALKEHNGHKISVLPPKNHKIPGPVERVKIMDRLADLPAKLGEFECVITSFGLTAMEAAFQGIPCLTVNPSVYHCKLASLGGFPTSRRPGIDEKLLNSFLQNPGDFVNNKYASHTPAKLSDFLFGAEISGYPSCPVCGERGTSLARNSIRAYLKCPQCGLIYLFSMGESKENYSKNYFFEEYKKQYGKTYLEDFDLIKERGYERLKCITGLSHSANKKSLDIGCAFGPFLKASAEAGFKPTGCDIAEEALEFIKSELGFPTRNAKNESVFRGGEMFSLITMWYVIEHLEDLTNILKDVSRSLEPNGVFAFSTPNASGISGRKNLKKFLLGGPKDHYTVWSPKSARKTLANFGLKVKKIVVTGHHPERFRLPGCRKGPLRGIYLLISKIFGLGDTFEAYAVKMEGN